METKMDRAGILNLATQIITQDRSNKYGEPEDNFRRIADLWAVYLGQPITSSDVAHMMILLKVGRLMGDNETLDTYIDIAGYAACAGELLEEMGERV